MNCFDEVQCEETPEHQWATMMQELQFLKERIGEKDIEIQKELDELSDKNINEIFAAELDF
jgi:hypothetical protein